MHSTEDKAWWCNHGLKWERDFVQRVAPRLRLQAKINPEKASNPYAPDLIVDDRLADLKFQGTPFFKAEEFYGLEPQYTYSFNRKDYLRYAELYPNIVIYKIIYFTKAARGC